MHIDTDPTSWRRLQVHVSDDGPIYIVAGALLATCLVLFWTYDIGEAWADALLTNAHLYFAAALGMLIIDMLSILGRESPAAPVDVLLARYRARLADPRIVVRLPVLVIAVAFMPSFSALKSMIPLFNADRWDTELIAWDRALLFGHDAAGVLQPLVGQPLITSMLAFLYHAWILVIYVGTLFFLFYRAAAPVARQYFLGFLLSWTLIGVAMATAFPSVGPCFVGPILGDATFDAQMAYLRTANEQFHVPTLVGQEQLLQWYREGSHALGSGLSAMPSMHVAMAQLTWLAMRRISRWAAQGLLVFTATIWVGSVHLGYHYAVDGLVAIIATTLIWSASGLLLRAWDRRHAGALGRKVPVTA